MKTIYLILHGSCYSNDEWEIICAFSTNEAAKAFKESQTFSNLYHIKPIPLYDETEMENENYNNTNHKKRN